MNKSADIAKTVTVNLLRFALALTFAFSGFVKAADPMGTVHKLTEYADVLGLTPHPALLMVGAWVLIGVEYVMGVCLLFGLYRRFYLTLMTAFLAVATPFTLWVALTNPVSDCGCFGDALLLTHWQTFGKNVCLLVMTIATFVGYGRIRRLISDRTQWLIFVYAVASIVLFMQHELRHLPTWDFRPYSIGTNIAEAMTIPDDAPRDEYETLFVMEREGEERTFTFDEYPDSTWHLVRRESRLVSKGYVPPITDFYLATLDGEEVTEEVLAQSGYTFLLVARDLRYANEGMLDIINDLYDYARVGGHAFYMVTASPMGEISEWTEHTGAAYPYLNADETLLKTVVRANLGLVLLKDATIVGKWSAADLPYDQQLGQPIEHNETLTITLREVQGRKLTTLLWMLLPLLLLVLVDLMGRDVGKLKIENCG